MKCLNSLWYIFFVEHWVFESNNVVTLENAFPPFPGFAGFFIVLGFFVVLFSILLLWTVSLLRISFRYKLKILALFWAFPRHAWALSTFPYMCSCFFNVLVFNVSFPKGNKHKKMKWGEGKSTGPLNLQVVTLGGGIASNNREKMQGQWLPASLFATVWSEKAITYQITDPQKLKITDPQKLKDNVLFAHPGSLKLFVSCSWNMYTAACHVTGVGNG